MLCFSRASTSSSLDGVCAVINNACTLLDTEFCQVLRQQLKQGYPSGYLDLTQAYNVLHSSIQQGRLQASDSEQARLMFLVSTSTFTRSPSPELNQPTFKHFLTTHSNTFLIKNVKKKGKVLHLPDSCL